MSSSRLVYSTEAGRICPVCGKAASKCDCRSKKQAGSPRTDGIIRIRREVKGRRGKTATVACGFEPGAADLKELAARLKRLCGSGGSVKGGEIIIQGDHRDTLKSELTQRGFKVKLAGG